MSNWKIYVTFFKNLFDNHYTVGRTWKPENFAFVHGALYGRVLGAGRRTDRQFNPARAPLLPVKVLKPDWFAPSSWRKVVAYLQKKVYPGE